jgi:deoxyribose-phosphate aldolase
MPHGRRGLRLSDDGRAGGAGAGGSGIPVASVATGFPAGLMPLDLRLAEIRYAVDQGAPRSTSSSPARMCFRADWAALYDEIAAMREACGAAHLKAILATGDLVTLRNVYAPRWWPCRRAPISSRPRPARRG